jgi:hypothetical protein
LIFSAAGALLDSAGALDDDSTAAGLEDSGADDDAAGVEAAADEASVLLAAAALVVVLLLELSFLLSPHAANSMVLETMTAARRIPLETRTGCRPFLGPAPL